MGKSGNLGDSEVETLNLFLYLPIFRFPLFPSLRDFGEAILPKTSKKANLAMVPRRRNSKGVCRGELQFALIPK